MVFLYLILALTSLSNAATIRDLCAKAKVQSMKRQQSACISKILDNLMSQDNQNPSEVCKIINEATFECIQVFAQCQMHDEVKAMQDHQWELFSKLFAQNDSVIAKMINECPTEKDLELKDRNRRNVSSGKRMKCDEAALMNTMKEFFSCLDGVFHNLSISIGDQTSAKHIYDLFCDGVKDVISKCTCFLNECFEPNDMIKMQGKNLQLLQSIFIDTLKTTPDETMIENLQCKHLTDVGCQRNQSASIRPVQNIYLVATIILVVLKM